MDNKTKHNKPKFINPVTDFGFKRIFGDKELMLGFVNALMKKQYPDTQITDIAYCNVEELGENINSRKVTYDLRCTTADGSYFILEMQNDSQDYFTERIVWYMSRTVSSLKEKGYVTEINDKGETIKRDWDYHIGKVYGVFMMNFKDARRPMAFSHVSLLDTESHDEDTDVFQYWKIQLPFYRELSPVDCKTEIDYWLYNIANMGKIDSIFFKEQVPLLNRLEKMGNYYNLDAKAQMLYDDSLNNLIATADAMQHKWRLGRATGFEEGREEGAKQKAIETARNLKIAGIDLNIIAQATGLSVEEISEL